MKLKWSDHDLSIVEFQSANKYIIILLKNLYRLFVKKLWKVPCLQNMMPTVLFS